MAKLPLHRIVFGIWMAFVTLLAGLPLATQGPTAFRAAPSAPAVASSVILPVQLRLNSGGVPMNGSQFLDLQLYTDPVAGVSIYREVTTTQVVNGVASVSLGNAPIFGNLSNVFSSTSGSIWLGVNVNAAGEMSPRIQVGSAPFAFNIPDGVVTTAKLADASVTSAKIVTGAVGNTQLASGLDGAKLADYSVAGTKLITGAVGNTQLASGLDGAKLADYSVAGTKLITGAVGNTQLASGLDGAKLAAGSVGNTQLGSNISGTKLAVGSVGDAQIGAVGAGKITGSIADSQIAGIGAGKITGSIIDSQIAGIGAGKITGSIIDSQIAGVSAGKISGELSQSQIADNAVGSGEIINGSVGGNELASTGFGASNQPLLNYVPVANRVVLFTTGFAGPTQWEVFDFTPYVPSTASAVHIIVSGQDGTYTGASSSNDIRIEKCCIAPGAAAQDAGRLIAPLYLGSTGRNTVIGIVPLDSSRRISYKLTPQSSGTITMTLVLLGHFEPANK
jgi:hypothetical protein